MGANEPGQRRIKVTPNSWIGFVPSETLLTALKANGFDAEPSGWVWPGLMVHYKEGQLTDVLRIVRYYSWDAWH